MRLNRYMVGNLNWIVAMCAILGVGFALDANLPALVLANVAIATANVVLAFYNHRER